MPFRNEPADTIFGHSGQRDGWVFTNLQNAYGEYLVTVVSDAAEIFEIVHDP